MLLELLLALQVPEPAVWLRNPSARAQETIVSASMPLPRHWRARGLAHVTVGDEPASWYPLVRWPDGSLAVVRLHWVAHLPPACETRLPVRCEVAEGAPPPRPDVADPWPESLPVHTEVVDPWGRVHVARLQRMRDAWRGMERVQTFHGRHVDAEHGTALLDVHVQVRRHAGEPFGEMTVVLDNGRCSDAVLGAVRFQRFSLVTGDPALRLRPRWASANLLRAPAAMPDAAGEGTCFRQDLLGPSPLLYLGDGTAKAFRFDVAWGVVGEAQEAAVHERLERPPVAFPDLAWVRACRAFGLHGGPAPVVGPTGAAMGGALAEWLRTARLGPFGDFGDAREAVVPGSGRNGACALHNVLRWRSSDLLEIAQAQMLQGMLRPLPGAVASVPATTAPLRQGLSARALREPHGFESLEYEGISVDLLFDLWWLTGDPLVRDELRRTGAAIRRLLQRLPFLTSRGEGWCAQALAAVAIATEDAELLAWAAHRMRSIVLPRLSESPYVALAQPPHPDALGGSVHFDAPWQMAALVHGLHALHRATEDDEFAVAAVDVARRMAVHGWKEGVGPKYLLSATDPGDFCLAREDTPLAGTARFLIGAFVLAREHADGDAPLSDLFAARARAIVDGARDALGILGTDDRADRWLQLWLDREERGS